MFKFLILITFTSILLISNFRFSGTTNPISKNETSETFVDDVIDTNGDFESIGFIDNFYHKNIIFFAVFFTFTIFSICYSLRHYHQFVSPLLYNLISLPPPKN